MKAELVTRAGCHLCQEAEALLRQGGVDLSLRDVDEDAELLRLYDFRVPVLLQDGRVLAEGRITVETLARLKG